MYEMTSDDLRAGARSARENGHTGLALALEVAADECDAPHQPSTVSLELADLVADPIGHRALRERVATTMQNQ